MAPSDAIGGARSAGCLRASNPDMVSLFARVPLGHLSSSNP